MHSLQSQLARMDEVEQFMPYSVLAICLQCICCCFTVHLLLFCFQIKYRTSALHGLLCFAHRGVTQGRIQDFGKGGV